MIKILPPKKAATAADADVSGDVDVVDEIDGDRQFDVTTTSRRQSGTATNSKHLQTGQSIRL